MSSNEPAVPLVAPSGAATNLTRAGEGSTDLTDPTHKTDQGRARDDVTGGAQAECGFCTRGRWHNPRTNQRELCPYCDGSGYVARAGLRRHADRLCAVCMAEEALNG